MENFDFGRTINIFLVAFVIFIAIMIAFVARMVSTFMVRNTNTNLTSAYAQNDQTIETPIETLHTTTVSLNNIGDAYVNNTEEEKKQNYEVLLTIAQARKQALLSVIEENPEAIFSSIFPQEIRDVLPAEAQIFIENEIIIEGSLKLMQVENTVTHERDRQYTILARSGDEFLLYIPEKIVPPAGSNIMVRIQGIQIDNKIVVQTIKTI